MKKEWMACLMAVMIFMLMGAPAGAQVEVGEFTLSPMAGGYNFDGDRPLENWGRNYALGLGYNLSKHFATELFFNFIHTDSSLNSGNSNVYAYQPHLDFLYHFMPDNDFVPYLSAGIGGMFFDDDKMEPFEVEDQFQMNGGVGAKYFINKNWALRADAKYYLGFDDSYNEFVLMAGVVYQFGDSPEPPAPCEDYDNDGVCDDVDQCLNTPAGAMVDSTGCEVRTAEPPAAPPKQPVVETPKRMEVIVYFNFDQSEIQPDYYDLLDRLAAFMMKNPGATATIEGHTDSIGSEAYNDRLSMERSESIKAYLVSRYGIDGDRFELRGLGESSPAAPNTTSEGRALNRRGITISVVE